MFVKENRFITMKHIIPFLLCHMPTRIPDNGSERPPSIEIFKIACLNKELFNIIMFLFSPLNLIDFGKNYAMNKLMDVLYLPVDLEKRYHNSTVDILRYK